jgi:hypothetical protein
MNKTKVEKEVDHEQERVDRIKQENAVKRAAAAERVSKIAGRYSRTIANAPQKKAEAELAKTREAEKAARSYDTLFDVEEDPSVPRKYGKELEEDFM